MKVTLDDIRARESRHVLQTYRRQPVAFVRGRGPFLYDVDGREYLDFVSGIGVTSLGHAHPGLTAAIADQAATLLHTSNLYYHPFQAEAAARLAQLSGLPRVFFCNSGTEAVEACLKFARRYWYTQGATDRTEFVALEGGFSGRTLGALSVTHDEHYRAPFAPLLGPVTFVDPNDPDALGRAVSDAHGRDHRGADPGRGRHPPDVAGLRAGHQRGLPQHRHAVHRRRSPDRARTHRPSLLRRGARADAGSHLGRQGARLGGAGRRLARLRARRAGDLARRPRQHVRRQPARDAGRRVLPRATDGPWPARARESRRGTFRAPAARARASASGGDRGARRGPDVRPPAARRCDGRDRRGARTAACW